MNYWISRGGQKYGPYSLEDIRRMIAEGSVAPTDLAWHEGLLNWAALSEVVPLPAPPVPPPVAPVPSAAPPAAPGAWNQFQPPPQVPYAGAAPNPGLVASGPIPPDLHWALVLLFHILSCGIFGIVWFFVEANFAKKIDRQSNAILLGILGFIGSFVGGGVRGFFAVTDARSGGEGIGLLIQLAGGVLLLVAAFGIRKSLEEYYNQVEPIGLDMSGVMTFFFSIFYFQHHFSRIARWKKTGVLTPQ
jgi:uncharacterized membrane protein YeaQ/YmgE (transglycosylase-associated protein family)